MTLKERIEKVRELIGLAEVKLESEENKARTMSGEMVEWEGEGLTKGAKLYVMSEEGRKPAENGEYELENGDIVLVEAGSIKDVLQKQHEEMNEFNAEQFEADILSKIEGKIAEVVEQKFAEIEAKFSEVSEKLEASKSEANTEVLAALENIKVELSKLPEETPAKEEKVEFSEKKSYAEIIDSIKQTKIINK